MRSSQSPSLPKSSRTVKEEKWDEEQEEAVRKHLGGRLRLDTCYDIRELGAGRKMRQGNLAMIYNKSTDKAYAQES